VVRGAFWLQPERVPSLLITPETKRMQRKNDGGKKIQLWLANDIIALSPIDAWATLAWPLGDPCVALG